MKLEDIIIARPGYNEKYKEDVSWEELKESFTLYKRIPMIVAGGDHYGPINPRKAIGFVDAKIDDNDQIIRGEPVFYKKKFNEVPAEIQRRLLHKEFIPVSLGYEPFQDIRKIDHIAIGVESPLFKDIGFHAESSFRYEETEGINKPEEETEATVQKEEPKPERDTGFNEIQMNQIREIFTSLLQAPPPSTEKVEEEVPTEEPQEETLPDPQPTPQVEPARTLSKTTGTPSKGQWLTDKDGRRYMSWPVAGQEETK